ncbi:MAG: cardiolipin synthase [Clostridia bacterium]|nr:cardiolipin synthase [Clostridia bacterium]
MKRKFTYRVNKKIIEKEINHIPVRYITAVFISALEVALTIAIMVVLCIYVPYFYIATVITYIASVITIIASEDNPDYKIPWLVIVLTLPIAGFMLYFMFYSRKLKKKYISRLVELHESTCQKDDSELFEELRLESPMAHNQAKMLCNLANTHLFTNTKQVYFSLGEQMYKSMLEDLSKAEKFIYMEYFIIEEGEFWNSILEILKQKANAGLEIKVVYDDIGCMNTLPGNYYKQLQRLGIECVQFSKFRIQADSEFNNRSHRKITIIDGKIAYTGGVNLADEYINKVKRHGHWKDGGIRLEGEAVWELTDLFLVDFGINTKNGWQAKHNIYPKIDDIRENGYLVPFGDGPRPMYKRRVAKTAILQMLNTATEYVYITTPYLIIDNELCQAIENTALRGVDVKIITPHIPDKKFVFSMTRAHYQRFIDTGVQIYEYTPGFIHAKNYIADDKYAIIGTVNLDYRSLVHHFENGVWMYKCDSIKDIKADIEETIAQSERITKEMTRARPLQRLFRSLIKLFSPLL